jgi:hypothetical protein
LRSFGVNSEAIGVWVTSVDHDECVAEVSLETEIALDIELFLYQKNFDGEKVDVANKHVVVEIRPEIKLVLEMHGPLTSVDVPEQIKRMSIGEDPIIIGLKRADLGEAFVSSRAWDDDVPF